MCLTAGGWWEGVGSTLGDLGSRNNICDKVIETYEAIWGGLDRNLGVFSGSSGEVCRSARETQDGCIEGAEGLRDVGGRRREGWVRESGDARDGGRRERSRNEAYFEHPTNQKRHEQNSRQANISHFVPKGEQIIHPVPTGESIAMPTGENRSHFATNQESAKIAAASVSEHSLRQAPIRKMRMVWKSIMAAAGVWGQPNSGTHPLDEDEPMQQQEEATAEPPPHGSREWQRRHQNELDRMLHEEREAAIEAVPEREDQCMKQPGTTESEDEDMPQSQAW